MIGHFFHSTHLLRMWRTGAHMMAYTAKEDEDFDVCGYLYVCYKLNIII